MTNRLSLGNWARARVVTGLVLVGTLVALSVQFALDTSHTGTAATGKFGLTSGPFFGHYEWPREFWRWFVAAAFGVIVVFAVARISKWTRLGAAVVMASVLGSGWAWCLQWVRNKNLELLLTNETDYSAFLPKIDHRFFVTYIEQLQHAPTHVRGHPPLAVGTVWLVEQIVPGAFALAMVILGALGLGMILVLDTVRRTAGAQVARAALIPVTVIPSLMFAFVSFDTVIMFELALATWLATLATRSGWRAILAGGACGVVCGVLIFTTYGGVTMLVLPIAVLWRKWVPTFAAALGGGAVVAFIAGLGFWWLDGFEATKRYYLEGISSIRPYWYFTFFANPALVAISIGPGAVLGWFRKKAPLVAWAGLAAAGIANLSGMSKGEVERIWVPFMPWIAVAGAGSGLKPRTMAALSVAMGLIVTLVLNSPW